MMSVQPFLKSLLRLAKKHLPKLDFRVNNGNGNSGVVVLLNLDSIGDCILFSSVIMSARKSYPLNKLVLVTLRDKKELFNQCDQIDRLILINKSKVLSPNANYYLINLKIYLRLMFHFRGTVLKLFGPGWLMFEDWAVYTKGFLQNMMRNNLVPSKLPNFKIVDRQHQVPRMLDIASIHGLSKRVEITKNWLPYSEIHSCFGIARNRTSLLIAMGSGHPRRSWPTESYIELIQMFTNRYPEFQVIVVGVSSSIPNVELLYNVQFRETVKILIDQTNLQQVKALIVNSKLVISNDSGISHLAASENRFVCVISSHSLTADSWQLHSPNRYFPWRVSHLVIQPKVSLGNCTSTCKEDEPHCIRAISAEEVFSLLKSVESSWS